MIEKYIKKISKHTAVYWGTPTSRADGSNSYGTPVEISCFWNEQSNMTYEEGGKTVHITAKVYVSQDLDEQGMLFLGTLADLTTAQENDPRKISRAYEITRFLKTPSLYKKTEYNRCAIIAPKSTKRT